ncbi:MAG: hypothetical protein OEX21_09625, partial [Betaproteobacteria bacterium]|nr:hypothetical protein [Betaproteobacteria bacterium]
MPGFVLGLAVAGLLGGCGPEGPAPAKQGATVAERAPAYAEARQGLGAAIDSGLSLAGARPDDGLLPLEVASLYVERARLTGDYADFARAQALLDSRPPGSKKTASHCLAQARLHYTLHRLARAAETLAACPPGTDPAELGAIRADIAMYSGRYREAEAGYRSLLNQSGTPQQYVRLALLKARTGSPAEATALLEAAEKRYHGGAATMKAWLRLQRGLVALDRGRFDEALALYRLAGDALAGWWLVDEHVAEVTFLRGDARAARDLYASVLGRTGAPEFMDALAVLEAQEGRAEPARALLREARALHERRLSEFPEAAAGHALAHFLRDAGEARRALDLARANFAARPYGEAAIALARAWMLSGKPERAPALLEAQL